MKNDCPPSSRNLTQNVIRAKIPGIQHVLLLLFAFSLPVSVAVNNILAALIILLWLIEGDFGRKFEEVKDNPIVIWALVFFFMHIIGLIWTHDLKWGLHIISKETKLLFLPILMTAIDKKHVKTYLGAFVAAMSVSAVFSCLIWAGAIPYTASSSAGSINPFMSHISYTPYLALTIYVLLHEVLFDKTLSRKHVIIALIIFVTLCFSLFISGGRAGQIGFFALFGLIVLQYFHKRLLKGILLVGIGVPLLFTLLYNVAPRFQQRIDLAIQQAQQYKQSSDSQLQDNSVGLRLTFLLNSVEVIKAHPLLGVGTGDFREEYAKINEKVSPGMPVPDHPHDMYALVLAQLGLLGFFPFALLFFAQIKVSFAKISPLYRIQLALPLLFLVIMLSDSYLMGHFVMGLFIFFSAILYKDSLWTPSRS